MGMRSARSVKSYRRICAGGRDASSHVSIQSRYLFLEDTHQVLTTSVTHRDFQIYFRLSPVRIHMTRF